MRFDGTFCPRWTQNELAVSQYFAADNKTVRW